VGPLSERGSFLLARSSATQQWVREEAAATHITDIRERKLTIRNFVRGHNKEMRSSHLCSEHLMITEEK